MQPARLLSHTARNGWTTRYTYNAAGQLTTITNAFGRTLSLAYNSAGLLSSREHTGWPIDRLRLRRF
jgi:YD repeat-containing protein